MSSKRLIRKESLVSKVQSFPFDFYLYLNELRLSIDWDEYATSVGLPTGIGLCSLSLIIQSILSYYNSINKRSKNVLFDSNYYQYENLKSVVSSKRQLHDYEINTTTTNTVVWLFNAIQSIVIFLSILNTILIFASTRDYQLLYHKTKPKYKSAVHPADRESYFYWLLYHVVVFFSKDDEAEDEDDDAMDTTANIEDGESWQLRTWQPSKFSLYFFVGLNPINNIIIANFTQQSSSLSIIVLLSLVSYFNYKLIDCFLSLVQDKQIIYQETFKEFNDKFVKPKTNVLKKDAMVDATLGPLYSSVLVNHEPYTFTKSKVFTTHDPKGKEVKEFIDSGSDETVHPNDFDRSEYRSQSRNLSRFSSRRSSIYDRTEMQTIPPFAFRRGQDYASSTPYDGLQQSSFSRMQSPSPSRYSNSVNYNRSPNSARNAISQRLSPQKLSPGKPDLAHPRRDSIGHSSIHSSPSFHRSPSPQRSSIFYRSPSPTRHNDRKPGWR
ncbi:NUR1 [Candida theae]|uniref:Nuclear rim protein 1 n=1 Tax=Candida theae TaxID=1198502 RepID=A0AAD5BIF0_9ASCO|nr:NUR1 [Candida theae]KAI5965991.1 NUR1 [Candida theae]